MIGRFMKKLSFSVLVLVSLAMLVTAASASVLSIENGQVTAIGSTAAVNMKLDTASAGLSGYSINVTVDDPSVAMITAVSFPAWAALSDTSILPSSSCQIKAVDLHEQVQSGASDVPLATITLQGLKAGSTPVIITLNKMNDDTDALVQPLITSGTFIVTESGQPTAAFTATPSSGAAPLSVQFTDQSTGSPTGWAWDFTNDGAVDSNEQNPGHIYDTDGTYTVKLTATGQGWTDDATMHITVGTIATPEFPSPILPVMFIGAMVIMAYAYRRE
jgi:PKD repeat protein